MRKHKTKQAVFMMLAAAMLSGLCACSKVSGKEGSKTAVTENAADVDTKNACNITLSGNSVKISGKGAKEKDSVITVTEKGTYVISGTLDEGRLVVNAPKQEVTLVLENADITCSYGSPIYVYKSSLTTVCLAEKTDNYLADGNTYTFDDSLSSQADDEPNACLYSKSDLTVTGSGSLTVNASYNNGITSKDILNIESASLTVTAANHGIKGKDGCTIKDADISVTSQKDGIHTEADLVIAGGNYQISSGDDGMHADKNVQITDGTIQIEKSNEGIEGETVDISGGTIEVTASDDGINAAGDSGAEQYINISGGKITVDASGDGLDSNGNLTVSGGEVYVSGPENGGNSALDYDGTATITGGTVIAAGCSGMAQNFGEDSTQGSILLNFDSFSNEEISVTDSSGKVLAEYKPVRSYNCVVVSCPSLTKGNTYTVNACGQSELVTLDNLIYGNSSGAGGRGGHPDGMNPHDGSKKPGDFTPPDGETLPGDGRRPDNGNPPDDSKMPDGPQPPDGTISEETTDSGDKV